MVTERPQGNEIEVALPEMTAAPTAIQNSVDQVFESNYFGIKFNAPEGWLIQQPPKSNPGSPDIVAVGASTGGLPPSISITIKDHTGKTFDEIIEEKGVKLFVDPGAIMYLLGTEMDYKKEEFSSSFVFKNPNETERCGCGESFKI